MTPPHPPPPLRFLFFFFTLNKTKVGSRGRTLAGFGFSRFTFLLKTVYYNFELQALEKKSICLSTGAIDFFFNVNTGIDVPLIESTLHEAHLFFFFFSFLLLLLLLPLLQHLPNADGA